jgi:hypothetical protein
MDRIASHELLEEIGRGGFGRVYRARHIELGLSRAVKIATDPEFVRQRRTSENGDRPDPAASIPRATDHHLRSGCVRGVDDRNPPRMAVSRTPDNHPWLHR